MKKKNFSSSVILEKNASFLNSILAKPKSRKSINEIVSKASEEQLLCLVEICLNLLKGRLPFHRNRINNLQNQAALLRKISRTRSASSARRLLIQKGGGFPPVAGLLASIAFPLIVEYLAK